MKILFSKILKVVIKQFFLITILLTTTVLAVSWPASTPIGESAGGLLINYFNNINGNCPPGEAISGFDNNNLSKICTRFEMPGRINGVCGVDNGGNFTTIPTNLCSAGVANSVIDNGEGSTYNWTCQGENGGSDVNCIANHILLQTCSEGDITVGTYTIMSCNLGTNTTGFTPSSYGKFFQWGNNYGSINGGTTLNSLVDASSYGPGNYYTSTGFILSSYDDWSTFQNDNLWGNSIDTNIARQGPCPSGYHVPTNDEWLGIIASGGWGTNGTTISNNLKLPMSGIRYGTNASTGVVGSVGFYWTSTPIGTKSKYFAFNSSITQFSDDLRSNGLSIRCFKN